jgi:hypothetical protein
MQQPRFAPAYPSQAGMSPSGVPSAAVYVGIMDRRIAGHPGRNPSRMCDKADKVVGGFWRGNGGFT